MPTRRGRGVARDGIERAERLRGFPVLSIRETNLRGDVRRGVVGEGLGAEGRFELPRARHPAARVVRRLTRPRLFGGDGRSRRGRRLGESLPRRLSVFGAVQRHVRVERVPALETDGGGLGKFPQDGAEHLCVVLGVPAVPARLRRLRPPRRLRPQPPPSRAVARCVNMTCTTSCRVPTVDSSSPP